MNTNIGTRAISSNVYTKTDIDTTLTTMNTNIGTRALSSNVYNRVEIDTAFSMYAGKMESFDLGETFRIRHTFDNTIFSIDKLASNFVSGDYTWKSLFSIVYNTTTTLGTCTMPHNLSVLGNVTVNGTISASNSNPFWIAGKVDGASLSILSSSGRYGFTVTRATGYASGIFYISFGNNPYKDANYAINVTAQGFSKIWESIIPTTTGFYVLTYPVVLSSAGNCAFHFSVIA